MLAVQRAKRATKGRLMRLVIGFILAISVAANIALGAWAAILHASLSDARSALARRDAEESATVEARVERRIQAEIAERRRLRAEIDQNEARRNAHEDHLRKIDEKAGAAAATVDQPAPTGTFSEVINNAGSPR